MSHNNISHTVVTSQAIVELQKVKVPVVDSVINSVLSAMDGLTVCG